jgi:hypothetical protein
MTRSRLVVVCALGLVVAAAAAALGTLALQPAPAPLGPVPAAALALPGDSPVLIGLDVRKLTKSSFYQKQVSQSSKARLDAFKEIEEKTGLNPERDVDTVVFAGTRESGPKHGVALVMGRFDAEKLGTGMTQRKGVTSSPYKGTPLFSFADGDVKRSLAVLDASSIVLGEEPLVQATIDNRGGGRTGLASNPALAARLARVRPGATFWMVGDASALKDMPASVPGAGGGGAMTLPALQQIVISGDFDPQISVDIIGDTADDAGAKNLADMLRGFIAFGTVQAASKPELAGLATAFNVAQDKNQVTIAVRLPPELVEALQKTAQPAAPPAISPAASPTPKPKAKPPAQ